MKSLLVSAFTLCSLGAAQNVIEPLPAQGREGLQPRAIQLQGVEWVVPELILGGEWTTSIRLTNEGNFNIPTTNVYFKDNNGNPMNATFQTSSGQVVTGAGFSFSLGIGGIVEGTFLGGSAVQFGQAFIGCSSNGCGTPGLYGEVQLTNHNATRPDFQSVFPLEMPATGQYMLFEGRNGFTTTLYVANAGIVPTTVNMAVYDVNANLVANVPIALPASGSQILTLHVIAPQTIGIQGTLSFTSSQTVTITGLRIDPSNSFTPLRTFIPHP
jgi:hypothetical protein